VSRATQLVSSPVSTGMGYFQFVFFNNSTDDPSATEHKIETHSSP
jgi:hypothetical protein